MTTKREEQIEAIGEYLATQPNYGCSPSDIRRNYPHLFHEDTNRPDVGQALKPMLEAGWVVKTGKRRVELTPKGRKRFAQKVDDVPNVPSVSPVSIPTNLPAVVHDAGTLGEILDVLPPVQSSFVEMMACAIVARHHFGETRTSYHPAFMVVGETGTGKTALARILCRMFGFDETMHVQLIGQKTVGELRGRRANTPMGWMYQLPEEMTLPFVVFDEYDKATIQKREAVLHYFQGETLVRVESAYYQDLSVPMLVANPPRTGDRYEMLRPEYRRRAFVLDTAFMKRRGSEVEEFIRNAYALTENAVIDLKYAKPTTERVTDAAVIVLQTVRDLLTDDGQEEYPGTTFLETLVLGYCGLHQTNDTAEAAYRVGYAYLLSAETVGHAKSHAVVAWHDHTDLTNAEAWSQNVKEVVKKRPAEVAVRDETTEYATELKWLAVREKWATHFEDLADDVENPPSDWNTRENRKVYRTLANVLRTVADHCRAAKSQERLKAVITASQQYEAKAQEFVDQWGEEEDEEEYEETEVVQGEVVEEGNEYQNTSTALAQTVSVLARMRAKGGGSHLARATTLRVKYSLYTLACEKCSKENRRINGINWAEQAYNVDVVWSNGGISNTQHLCYPCAVATYREVEAARNTGRISYANFWPNIDTNPNPYMRQCALCIHPRKAECIVRYFGQDPWFKDLNGIEVCESHKIAVHQRIQQYPCRYDSID